MKNNIGVKIMYDIWFQSLKTLFWYPRAEDKEKNFLEIFFDLWILTTKFLWFWLMVRGAENKKTIGVKIKYDTWFWSLKILL